MPHFIYKRPQLAVTYCDSLAGKGIANSRSGLFSAAPRQVGKTTFLVQDLIPEARSRGWTVIYIDLWFDKQQDPAILISAAIKKAITAQENKLTKLLKRIKLSKLTLMNIIAVDLSESTLPIHVTLADALQLLGEITGKPTLVIIDEAQHALTTPAGANAMFALKAARDYLNRTYADPALMLVFTGSNRDKLAHLVLRKDQPFFGSVITPFPLLGKDFTDAFTAWVNEGLTKNNQFSEDSMLQALQWVGHRPDILAQIAGSIALDHEASHFTQLLEKDALIWKNRLWETFENDFNALTVLQQSVLEALIKNGRTWSPFSEESMAQYKNEAGQPALSTASIQSAIQALRDKGFIWQSARGAYALEDESVMEWYKYHRSVAESYG